MEKILSIVIPVYKVEKYLRTCLNSLILPQSIADKLEVIVINDGSPDNSLSIAQEYSAKYPNTFITISKANGGHGSVFNVGIEKARGKYIRFLDSDDWLDNSNLRILLLNLENCDADLIFNPECTIIDGTNVMEKLPVQSMQDGKLYKAEDFDWVGSNNPRDISLFHKCTYKLSILKPLQGKFREKAYYDDNILCVVPIAFAQTFIYFDTVLYYYRIGRDGQTISLQSMLKHYSDFTNVYKDCINFVNSQLPLSENKDKFLKFIINSFCWNHFKLLDLLPYKESLCRLTNWSEYIYKNVPYLEVHRKMRLFRKLPYPIYRFLTSWGRYKKIRSNQF